MTRRMLINAQRAEELRLAIISGETLDEYQVAVAEAGLLRGNVYRGTVVSLQPSLNAAFVDFGAPKHGFLACHDVVPQAYHHNPPSGGKGAPRIDQVLERGKPILVQVTKDPSGEKGAALTTNISLAGRYLVLMPFDEVRGISRKVEDEQTRQEVRALVAKLAVPEGFGYIVRTNALDQNKTALNRDLAGLQRVWKRIHADSGRGKGPALLYTDQDLIVQAVRDYLDNAIDEVLVDDDGAYERVREAMRHFMPRAKITLTRYRERLPLFSRFGLEGQIESIFKPAVGLPSGGSIVIEGTEALTAIDVNSGRSTRGANEEATAFNTNVEAAREVARQLRLRDIGGLIVVDFIDMRSGKHRREVEKLMKEAVKSGRARVSVSRISDNGLLEINRQRLKTPLVLRTHRVCPTCGGGGRIPSPETVSISLLRRIEERAAGGSIAGVRVALHPELADAFQNHYRQELASLEREFDLDIQIIAATSLHRSQEEISWTARPQAGRDRPAEAAAAAPAEKGRGRRRRPSRERVAEQAPPPKQTAPPPPPSEEAAPDTPPRKRRRGGRRHRKATVPASAPAPGSAEASAAEPSAAEASPAPAPENGETPPSPKKRRRRRRPSRRSDTPASESAGGESPGGESEGSGTAAASS